jgi:hypothetical protein
MTWKSIRLELARTPDFPDGSASRAYLLHLPLDDDGLVDGLAIAAAPERATIHRHWPDEPDLSGYVGRAGAGWVFSYRPGEEDDERIFHLETHPLRRGDYLTLTEPDGRQLPYRVAAIGDAMP